MNPDKSDQQDNTPDQSSVNNAQPDTDSSSPDPSQAIQSQPQQQPTAQPLPIQASPQPSPQAPQTPATASTASGQPMVTNQSPASPQASIHPAVRGAGVAHEIFYALAGSPTKTSIDANGNVTRVPAQLSNAQLALAIAATAISGSLTGLAQQGSNAAARGAAAAWQQSEQRVQSAQQAQEARAASDSKQRSDAVQRQAQAYELNSRVMLNTSQAERNGVSSLKDAVDQNGQLLSDYQDASAVQDSHVSQDALAAGMKSGDYSATSQIAIPDGWTSINGRFEQTFSIVNDSGRADVPLSNQQVRAFAAANIPGFLPYKDGKTSIPQNFSVKGSVVARANQQVQAISLMKQDVSGAIDKLSQSEDKGTQALAKAIPSFQTLLDDPTRGAGLMVALGRFQRYQSHSQSEDFADSLAQMASPSKVDPSNPKNRIPNGDAPFAQTIYGAFGNGDPALGRKILAAYHSEVTPDPIKSEADAASIIANNPPTSKAYRVAQRWLQATITQKAQVAGAEERAKDAASGTGTGAGNPALISSDPANGVNTAYLQSLPPAQQAIVRAIGEARQEGPNTRTKDGQALSQMVNNAYPDYDGTRYHTYQAMQRDFVSGKTSQGLLALNTALSHLDMLYSSANLGSTLPGVSGIERLTGDPSAVALKASSIAISDELGRAYKSGVVTESERKEWQSLLGGWTPANVRENAVAFSHLLDGKIQSYEQTLRNGAPSGAVRLPALMSPQAAQAYTRITGEYPTTSVGSNPVTRSNPSQPQPATQSRIVPQGATPGRDSQGNITGYRTATGQVVRFN